MLWFNFILGLKYYFPQFLGMILYENEFETKENKIKITGLRVEVFLLAGAYPNFQNILSLIGH